MKRRIKLTPILIALILSLGASLTSCNDSEPGTDSASVTVSQTEKETNVDTDAKTDSITSEAPTENVITETPVEDTEAPATTVPETKPAVTTAPETTAPEIKKEYASKEKYPDSWGESIGVMDPKGDMSEPYIRVKGNTFFWENSRVLHTIPKSIVSPEEWEIILADEENDQLLFFVFKGGYNERDIYSIVDGKVYKLNEEDYIYDDFYDTWSDYNSSTSPYYWIEKNGVAKSINVRSKKFNEVYVEAEGVRYISNPYYSFAFENSNGEVVKQKSENILAKVKEIK